MKISKMFLGITLIFSIMVMLIGCDVFDGTGKLGKDLNRVGKLADAFNEDVLKADNDPPNPPDQDKPVSFSPDPSKYKAGNSKYVFFMAAPDFDDGSDDIYIVIPKAMSPLVDNLFILGFTGPLKEIRDRNYPDAEVVSARRVDPKLSYLEMEKGTPPAALNTGYTNAFWIRIPGNLKNYTGIGWSGRNKGLRLEFTKEANDKTKSWVGLRLDFVSEKESFATMNDATFPNDPYAGGSDLNGAFYQIVLDFENYTNWYVMR